MLYKHLYSFSGADLAALAHDAGVIALRERIDGDGNDSVVAVTTAHFEQAVQRVTPSVSVADLQRYARLREEYAIK